jgi:NAD(P)-dependent dehydrogenase (short-subunit alcohol dehydrogenase family)
MKSVPFGARSTADNVLAGVDLTGKRFVVTGCNTGLGYETMSAFAANGATVIGLARSMDSARQACAQISPGCVPVACDLSDLNSVAAAVRTIHGLDAPLDAIVANAGVANLPSLQTRYGIEMQFLANHLGHFALVNELTSQLRDHSGRVVIVSSSASKTYAPAEGIMFDNLDGHRFYKPFTFYGQSKLANALYAKELSRRLSSRGIAVNSVHPGAARTGLNKTMHLMLRFLSSPARLFMKSAAQGAAGLALLAASPRVAGISGEYWADCKIAKGNPLLEDVGLARHLWDVSQELITRQMRLGASALQLAA